MEKIDNFLGWLNKRFHTIGLIVCIIMVWLSKANIFDFGIYYLLIYFGIPFFYILRRIDKLEEKISKT